MLKRCISVHQGFRGTEALLRKISLKRYGDDGGRRKESARTKHAPGGDRDGICYILHKQRPQPKSLNRVGAIK